ncbi:MAG TPA: metallophosphoesterase family protein [Firmicutes bacterium]|nr:metallophosphoesterase family protein [Bacillota bacterium]
MRIGVVSDTHIPARARSLPAQLFTGLMGVDMILHAGDLVDMQVLTELAVLAPVYAVHGNVDPIEIKRRLPRTRIVEAGAFRIGLVHGHGPGGNTPQRALQTFNDVHCVVFGHSHQALCERRGEVLLFNPGSPTDKRWSEKHSYGILTVTDAGNTGEIIYF